jgi:hypothetical protein
MRPRDAFDICHEAYISAKGAETRGIGTIRLEYGWDHVWRPDILPRAVDYVADFQRAGRRALGAPRWRCRLRMFLWHYCALMEYRAARARLGISEMTWSAWRDEIRDLVGLELMRAHVFPPGRYFKLAQMYRDPQSGLRNAPTNNSQAD